MLVVGLKEGEKIRVGDAVVVVIKLKGGIVKLGIDAPEEIEIDRIRDD